MKINTMVNVGLITSLILGIGIGFLIASVDAQEYSDNELTSVPITITSDKSIYQKGDAITISGSIKTLAEYSQSVTIVVVTPDGNIVTIVQVMPNADGTFSTGFKAPGHMVDGDHEIRAQYGAHKIISKFVYTSDVSATIPESIPQPESITIITDKSSYTKGDVIVIIGEVRDLYSGTSVSVIVKQPNGNLTSIVQVEVSTDKKFSVKIDTNVTTMNTSGTYTVTAQYGTANRQATTSFEFGGNNGNTANFEPISTPEPIAELEPEVIVTKDNNREISDLKKQITYLKLENRELKQKITSLEEQLVSRAIDFADSIVNLNEWFRDQLTK